MTREAWDPFVFQQDCPLYLYLYILEDAGVIRSHTTFMPCTQCGIAGDRADGRRGFFGARACDRLFLAAFFAMGFGG